MKEITFIFLTGMSAAGKSHLAPKLADQLGASVLTSDLEIMKRVFDILYSHELEKRAEKKLRQSRRRHPIPKKNIEDPEHLFRLYHRDWLARNDFPALVLADGWIYSRQKWRRETYKALSKLPIHPTYLGLVYRPSFEDFFPRFCQRVGEKDARFLELSEAERRSRAMTRYERFRFEPPEDEPELGRIEQVETEEEAIAVLRAMLNGAVSAG